MTINYINIGSSANKGDGDTLRTAFRKINENFAFLSTATGFYSTGSSTVLNISETAPSTDNGTLWFNTVDGRTYVRYNGAWVDASPQVTPPPTTGTEAVITIGPLPPETGEGSLWFNENDARTYINYSGAWIDSSPQVLPPPTLPADEVGVLANDGNGNLYWTTATVSTATVNFSSVPSSILPSDNLTYDLGSLTKQWRSLYVGTSTIYIGGVAVSINTSSNTLVIGTSTNAVNIATEDYVDNIITTNTTPTGIALRNYEVLSTGTNNFIIAGSGIADSTVTYDFRIHGTVVGANIDYVTITVGPNPISAIYLTKYVSLDNRAFFAVQEGNQWTIPQDQVTPEMLAYGHFGPANLNANILSFNNANAVLQANTTYTFWIQQTGVSSTEYVFSTVYGDVGTTPVNYSSNPLSPTSLNPIVTVVGGALDPSLTLIRGYKYLFDVNTPGHNFWIMTTSTYNSSSAYTHGITNNGTGSGVVSFTVPAEAPSTLYYMCDQHSEMSGVISIVDLENSSNSLANGVYTLSLASNGNLTFPDNLSYYNDPNVDTSIFQKSVTSETNDTIGSRVYLNYSEISLEQYLDPDGVNNNQYGRVQVSGNGIRLEITQELVGGEAYSRLDIAPTGMALTSTDGVSTNTYLFDGNTIVLPNDGIIQQRNSFTRTSDGIVSVSTPTVVWTSAVDYISSAKLIIQVECSEVGDASGWHSQACEAIIACRGYASVYGGSGGDPQMIVYGVVHTSVNPLVTFTVQRNPATRMVEVVGTPTAAASGNAAVKIHSVEMSTRD